MFFFSPSVGASKRGRSYKCFSALGASKRGRSKICVSSLQLFEQVKRLIKNKFLFSPVVGARGTSKICFSSSSCWSKQKRQIKNMFLFSLASKRGRSKICFSSLWQAKEADQKYVSLLSGKQNSLASKRGRQIKNMFLFSLASKRGRSKICFSSLWQAKEADQKYVSLLSGKQKTQIKRGRSKKTKVRSINFLYVLVFAKLHTHTHTHYNNTDYLITHEHRQHRIIDNTLPQTLTTQNSS